MKRSKKDEIIRQSGGVESGMTDRELFLYHSTPAVRRQIKQEMEATGHSFGHIVDKLIEAATKR